MSTRAAAVYLRQSKADDQGIDRQLERCRQLADLRGWTVAGTYVDDGISASKARGAGTAWERMLSDADAKRFEVVIGVDLDRLLRSTRDLNTLIDHDLAVITVDGEIDLSTADGEFRATMLAGIARFEVRRKGERQSRANAQRAALGAVPKGVRLTGYATDGTVIEDEATMVRALFEGFGSGETLRGLSRKHDLTSSTVRTILTNPRYASRRVYKGETHAGKWEAIVSGALFDVVNRKLADPARASNRTGSTSRRHLGTSLFECGECEGNPTVRTAGSGGRYWCPSCGMVRRMEPVDEYVLGVLYARLTRPDARKVFERDVDLEPLQMEARELRARKADLASLLADGTLTAADVKVAASTLDDKLAALDHEIAEAVTPGAMAVTNDEIGAGLETLSLDRLRALVDALMHVSLHRGARGVRKFDPETVTIKWRTA